MEDKQYKYDAFISYRHCDLDKFVAENLHRILESYELPKNIKEKLNIEGRTIKRVFRDQDELPLSSNLEDPIIDALNDSKYLIVICSPRLKDSLWCKKEIETFKRLRGRQNIFCVLIEGEPRDSFPEEADEIISRLETVGFEVIEMLFDVPNPNRDYNWAYINYLEVGNKIIVPTFGIPEDKQALKYIREANPDSIVRGFRMRDIARSGGALHCITWNIRR